MSEPRRRDLSNVEELKALAHPLRWRMLAWLQRHGSATSADLAAAFDEDRGATSYHLRQLARFGFIEEDADRSAGRRKYWREVPADLRLPRRAVGGETDVVADEVGRLWMARGEGQLHGYLADRRAHGEFATAAMHSFTPMELTAEELDRLGEDYLKFLNAWTSGLEVDPAERRHVTVLFHSFPTPPEEGVSGAGAVGESV